MDEKRRSEAGSRPVTRFGLRSLALTELCPDPVSDRFAEPDGGMMATSPSASAWRVRGLSQRPMLLLYEPVTETGKVAMRSVLHSFTGAAAWQPTDV